MTMARTGLVLSEVWYVDGLEVTAHLEAAAEPSTSTYPEVLDAVLKSVRAWRSRTAGRG